MNALERGSINRFGLAAPEVKMLEHGLVPAFGEVRTPMAYRVWSDVAFIESEYPGTPITLQLSGPGGDVDAGLAIIDACRCSASEVRTVATGLCASMSAVIAVCAAKPGSRHCTPSATFMLHEILGGAHGRASDVERTCEHMLSTRERIERMLEEATGLGKEEVRVLCRQGDRYLTAKEALEYGLVDHIVEWK